MAKEYRLILTLPDKLSESDVASTLNGLVKALGIEGSVRTSYFDPKGYDTIMSKDFKPLLLIPSDDILGSEAKYLRNGKSDHVEATISIRCSAAAWTGLVNGARR